MRVRCWLPWLLGSALAAQQSVVAGKPFTIRCHFQDDAIAQHAAAIAQASWAVALEHLRPDPAARSRSKFTLHLYRDAAAYHAAGEQLKSGHHKVAPAFSDSRSRSGHVLLQGDADEPGLPEHAMRMVAHEAMHLAVFVSNPGAMFLPEWFGEGLPLWVEGEAMRRLLGNAAIDDDPYQQRCNAVARKMIEDGGFPSLRQIAEPDLKTLSRQQRYDVWRQLAHFLAARPSSVWARLWTSSNAAWGPSTEARLRDVLAAEAPGGLDALDAELRAFVLARPLPERTVVPMPMGEAKGTPGAAGFLPAPPQVKWLGSLGQRDLELTAKVLLRDGGAPQADFVLERGGARWLRVTLHADDGVHVGERADDGSWRELGAWQEPAAVPKDRALALKVAVRGGKVEIDLGGKRVLAVAAAGVVAGRWGLGGPPGSRARWSDVRIR